MSKAKPKIGISIGDINGIGIEVIIKTFSDGKMFDYCTPIVYGSSKAISYHKNVLKSSDFRFNVISAPEKTRQNALNVINCWTEEIPITIGRPNKNTGSASLKALEAVAYDAFQGKIDAIATAPVNKNILSTPEKKFTGQTEFFTEKCNEQDSLMLLISEPLKVGLITNHLPIEEVTAQITKEKILRKIQLLEETLKRDFLIDQPKIGVLSLNPHAGEGGIIGTQDDEIVVPAIEAIRKKGNLAFGPYAADGFFGSATYRQFDAVLAQYHDQGLVPFKLLSFGHGVNYTGGLPIVRTSPDHGTAYDIAGKGMASEDSMRKAIFAAIDIARNRAQYAEMHANPLQAQVKFEKEKN